MPPGTVHGPCCTQRNCVDELWGSVFWHFFFFFCLHCRLKHIVFRFKWKIMYCKSSPRENTAASPIPLPSTNTLFVRSMSPIKTNRRTGTRSLLRAFCLLPSLMRSRPVNCIVQCWTSRYGGRACPLGTYWQPIFPGRTSYLMRQMRDAIDWTSKRRLKEPWCLAANCNEQENEWFTNVRGVKNHFIIAALLTVHFSNDSRFDSFVRFHASCGKACQHILCCCELQWHLTAMWILLSLTYSM